MKAIVVIDIDEYEDIRNYGVSVYHYPSRRFVHLDVPIKPLPQKKEIELPWLYAEYENGWNDCLDAITGKTE